MGEDEPLEVIVYAFVVGIVVIESDTVPLGEEKDDAVEIDDAEDDAVKVFETVPDGVPVRVVVDDADTDKHIDVLGEAVGAFEADDVVEDVIDSEPEEDTD